MLRFLPWVRARAGHKSQLFVGDRRAEVSSNSLFASFLPSFLPRCAPVRVRPCRSLLLPCRPPAPPLLGKWVSSTRRYLGLFCCRRRCQGCCHPGRCSDSIQRGRKTQAEGKYRQHHCRGRILVVDHESNLAEMSPTSRTTTGAFVPCSELCPATRSANRISAPALQAQPSLRF